MKFFNLILLFIAGNDDRLELFSRSADIVNQVWSFEGNTGLVWKQGQATVQASSTWQLVIQGIKKFQVAAPNLIGKEKSKNYDLIFFILKTVY